MMRPDWEWCDICLEHFPPTRADHDGSVMHITKSKSSALSDRQREVCERVARGMRESEIAWDLGISKSTVKMHKAIAYRKLGVRNAVELTLAMGPNDGRP